MRPHAHRRSPVPALAAALLAACGSAPTVANAARFYVQEPGTRVFGFERAFPGEQGWIRGTLTLAVASAGIAPGAPDTWRMSGTAQLESHGLLNAKEAAHAAPRRVVEAAMEPDNVDEVFEVVSSGPGVTVTRVHWDRLRALRLPLDWRHDVPPSPFDSSLRAEAQGHAAEVALVWHKVITPFFSIAPFGEYTASEVDERADDLALTLTHRLPNGETMRFRYRFARGVGLVGVEGRLDDGSTLRLTRRE